MSEALTRARVRVRGLVQGVGFRPFVLALARRHQLTGWVRNDEHGVLLEVQGAACDAFVPALAREAPPLSRVEAVEVEARPPLAAETGFVIEESARSGRATSAIGPDAATCPACLAELCDPKDRRYRYPFLNCTHCGPRYTITRGLPYDRPQTSMACFPMCADCAREYADPADRRFHAQPVACPACGPRMSMAPEEILARVRAGEIVGVKGLGGFHLVCDARDEAAVARLRRSKQRDGKPFAVMVAGLASARALAQVSAEEAALLEGPAHPVVLLRRTAGDGLAPSLAPGLAWLGVMLPYTPLQHLLFHEAAGRPDGTAWREQAQPLCLVMTSANPGGEPLVIGNEEAARRLAGIADALAVHDREILVRTDDGVARVVAGAPTLIRRARGHVPLGVRLPREVPPVLALGAHLKATLCLTRGDRAFVSQHLGDLDDAATYGFLEETLAHLTATLEVQPVAVAHDLHPDFLSTRKALELGLPAFAVQHHHAHLAAVLAEHRREGPAVGLALDGFGLGTDGGAWGGELLLVDGPRFTRLGHLRELRLPGGDRAAREPWRMAASALHALGRAGEIVPRLSAHGDAAGLVAMLDRGANSPFTSSCGRWFDAACGLLGLKPVATFEGEAPMLLESLVTAPEVLAGGWSVKDGVLDLLPLLDALRGCEPRRGANLFHGTLAAALVDWALPALESRGFAEVPLGGGCLLNRVLAEALVEGFARRGVAALLPREVPANDGGLSLGQAWIAAQLVPR